VLTTPSPIPTDLNLLTTRIEERSVIDATLDLVNDHAPDLFGIRAVEADGLLNQGFKIGDSTLLDGIRGNHGNGHLEQLPVTEATGTTRILDHLNSRAFVILIG
jgi:hypothetical protein